MQLEAADVLRVGIPLLVFAFGYGRLTRGQKAMLERLISHEEYDKERRASDKEKIESEREKIKEKIESERDKVKAISAAVDSKVVQQDARIDIFVAKIDKALFEEDGRSRFVSRQMCRECRQEYQGRLCIKIDELKKSYENLAALFSDQKTFVGKQMEAVQSYIALTGPILQALFAQIGETEGASIQTSCDITKLFADLISERINANKEAKEGA